MENKALTPQPLATELIRELKAQSKRWFIIAVTELGIIVAIVLAFLWYLTLPIDQVSVDSADGNATYIGRDLKGGLYNGENSSQTKSSENEKDGNTP